MPARSTRRERIASTSAQASPAELHSGAISAHVGIAVGDATFSGGITNAGTIAATHDGIAVSLSSFGGGITNSGTITATNFNGIQVNDTSTSRAASQTAAKLSPTKPVFSSPASRPSRGVSATAVTCPAIWPGLHLALSEFLGGITNTGTITGRSGIFISNSTQGINLFNSGTITGTNGAAVLFGAGPIRSRLGQGSR